MKMALFLCGLPPETPGSQSNLEKSIKQIQVERHSTKKNLTSTPQNCRSHLKNKKMLRNCYI